MGVDVSFFFPGLKLKREFFFPGILNLPRVQNIDSRRRPPLNHCISLLPLDLEGKLFIEAQTLSLCVLLLQAAHNKKTNSRVL